MQIKFSNLQFLHIFIDRHVITMNLEMFNGQINYQDLENGEKV